MITVTVENNRGFFKIRNSTTISYTMLLLAVCPQLCQRDTCSYILTAALTKIARLWNPPKPLSMEEWIKKNMTCIHNDMLFSHRKMEALLIGSKMSAPEGIVLSEISQTDKSHMLFLINDCLNKIKQTKQSSSSWTQNIPY